MLKLNCNCCDGIFNTIDVHFTKVCDNNCAHCVDKITPGIEVQKPNVKAITDEIISRADIVNDVLFLGGEPCLFLNELYDTVKTLKEKTHLKLYVTTSMPKVCYDNKEKLYSLIEMLDGFNISVQHFDEDLADKIRATKSFYPRQDFYKEVIAKYPDKVRICMNIVKGALDTKELVEKALFHYESMGAKSIKLSEIQNYTEYWVSFEKLFGIKLPSPYAQGCQGPIDPRILGPKFENFNAEILLRRSCFVGNNKLKANFSDLVKATFKIFSTATEKSASGIVYEDGSFHRGWI